MVDLDALYNESKTELEELRAFKAEYDKQIFESKLNDLLNKYSELRSIEGFEEILENGKELSLESLEKEFKIFAFDNGVVLGKKKFTAKKETTIKDVTPEVRTEPKISPKLDDTSEFGIKLPESFDNAYST